MRCGSECVAPSGSPLIVWTVPSRRRRSPLPAQVRLVNAPPFRAGLDADRFRLDCSQLGDLVRLGRAQCSNASAVLGGSVAAAAAADEPPGDSAFAREFAEAWLSLLAGAWRIELLAMRVQGTSEASREVAGAVSGRGKLTRCVRGWVIGASDAPAVCAGRRRRIAARRVACLLLVLALFDAGAGAPAQAGAGGARAGRGGRVDPKARAWEVVETGRRR